MRAALGPGPVALDPEESCIAVLGRCLLLYSFNAGEHARVPGNLPYFFFSGKSRIRCFCRWWRLAWKSTRVGAGDGRVVDGLAGQMGSGVWRKAVQDFPSGCDRAARSCAVRGHRVDQTGAMQNPSASNAAGAAGFCREVWNRGGAQGDVRFHIERDRSADPARRSGIGTVRITAMQNPSASSAAGPRDGTRPERSSHRPLRGCALSSVGQAKPDQEPAGRSSGAMQDPASTRATAA